MSDNPLGIVAREGDIHPVVAKLKRRFGFETVDSVYDNQLVVRIRGVQMMHSLTTHGQLDEATLKVLGVDQWKG